MLTNLKKKKIPTILLNGRITKKTYIRWKRFLNFSKKIFSNFDLCLSSSQESKNYLHKLGAKNVKFLGNLKFSQSVEEKIELKKEIRKAILKKNVWCASSTHDTEETFCGKVHKELKSKNKNLLTIIIPRHVERVEKIKSDLQKLNLKVQTYESKEKMKKDTDIYIGDSYGKTKSFYNYCENVFLGGSLINHGGQNPLEAARYGCNILHGPNVSNFYEIYKFLRKNKMSKKISSQKEIVDILKKLFLENKNTKKIQKKLNNIGREILQNTISEIKTFTKNEI